MRLCFRVESLQVRDNFGNSMLAVAASHDFEAGAIQTKRALRHKQDALIVVFAETATGCKSRFGLWIDGHGEAMIARKYQDCSSVRQARL